MQQTLELFPGITLRCMQDRRFKQSALSIQLLRPMNESEAAINALLPAVLLRGCRDYPDLQLITQRLDDLYGASIGTLVRRIGDYQTTGFYCGFMEDRFALQGDQILEPMIRFALQLLLDPVTEDDGFSREFIDSEKKNLISTIESERSDKRTYAAARLLRIMCKSDTFGIPRLGEIPQVEAIDHRNAYSHYRKILRESPMEIFYVGSSPMETVAALLRSQLSHLDRAPRSLPPQTGFQSCEGSEAWEQQNITQAKLSMGFVTPITNRDPRFAAMQVFNAIFGSGMTSKLFMEIREKRSLCYAIGSGYYGSKGILTVNAGIDTRQEIPVKEAIFAQLDACRQGLITDNELAAAKESILSGLRAVYDGPGAMENFFSTAAISGLGRTPETYREEIRAVTAEDVAEAAKTVTFHSAFFLKGASYD